MLLKHKNYATGLRKVYILFLNLLDAFKKIELLGTKIKGLDLKTSILEEKKLKSNKDFENIEEKFTARLNKELEKVSKVKKLILFV